MARNPYRDHKAQREVKDQAASLDDDDFSDLDAIGDPDDDGDADESAEDESPARQPSHAREALSVIGDDDDDEQEDLDDHPRRRRPVPRHDPGDAYDTAEDVDYHIEARKHPKKFSMKIWGRRSRAEIIEKVVEECWEKHSESPVDEFKVTAKVKPEGYPRRTVETWIFELPRDLAKIDPDRRATLNRRQDDDEDDDEDAPTFAPEFDEPDEPDEPEPDDEDEPEEEPEEEPPPRRRRLRAPREIPVQVPPEGSFVASMASAMKEQRRMIEAMKELTAAQQGERRDFFDRLPEVVSTVGLLADVWSKLRPQKDTASAIVEAIQKGIELRDQSGTPKFMEIAMMCMLPGLMNVSGSAIPAAFQKMFGVEPPSSTQSGKKLPANPPDSNKALPNRSGFPDRYFVEIENAWAQDSNDKIRTAAHWAYRFLSEGSDEEIEALKAESVDAILARFKEAAKRLPWHNEEMTDGAKKWWDQVLTSARSSGQHAAAQ